MQIFLKNSYLDNEPSRRSQDKVTKPNCDLFAKPTSSKPTSTDSRLKCTASVHESLGSILSTPIFSTLKIPSFLIRSPKNAF